jgi:diguanylate cyclase (GGDEF)-like protein/PAS domain S-box-containing protein
MKVFDRKRGSMGHGSKIVAVGTVALALLAIVIMFALRSGDMQDWRVEMTRQAFSETLATLAGYFDSLDRSLVGHADPVTQFKLVAPVIVDSEPWMQGLVLWKSGQTKAVASTSRFSALAAADFNAETPIDPQSAAGESILGIVESGGEQWLVHARGRAGNAAFDTLVSFVRVRDLMFLTSDQVLLEIKSDNSWVAIGGAPQGPDTANWIAKHHEAYWRIRAKPFGMPALGMFWWASLAGLIVSVLTLAAWARHGPGNPVLGEAAMSDGLFGQLADLLPFPVFLKNRGGQYIKVNEAFSRFLGRSAEDITGATAADIAPPELAARYEDMDRALYDNPGVQVYQATVRSADHVDREVLFRKSTFVDTNDQVAGLMGLVLDDGGSDTQSILHRIAESVSQGSGTDLYRGIVTCLSQELGLSHVFIGRLKSADDQSIETLIYCQNGEIAENFSYSLPGTPCEIVMQQNECIYEHGVQRLFPEDLLLQQMGIESYMGCPLVNSAGDTIGLLVTMDTKPTGPHMLSDFTRRILTDRAMVEIEREDRDRELGNHLSQQEAINSLLVLALKTPSIDNFMDVVAESLKKVEWIGPKSWTRLYSAPVDGTIEIEKAVGDPDWGREEAQAVALDSIGKSTVMFNTCTAPDGQTWACYTLAVKEGDRVLGVLQIATPERSGFCEKGGAFLSSITRLTATLMARRQALTDSLLATKIFEQTREGIIVTDARGQIISVNPAFTEVTGYSEDEAIGETAGMLSSGRHNPDFYSEMWNSIRELGYWSGEIWNRRKTGEIYPEWLNISRLRDTNGLGERFVGVFSDISKLKHAEEKLEFVSNFDPLTGLPNRILLRDRLDQLLARARREQGGVSVIFLDLDRFRQINESLGHPAGDRTLRRVANRLKVMLSDDDTVARIDGDTFVVASYRPSSSKNDYADVTELAERMTHEIGKPITLGEESVYLSPSIGISLFPVDGESSVELIRNADAAMYHARELGGNQFQFFGSQLNISAARTLAIESRLRSALANDKLDVHYQPQLNLSTEDLVGFEALARWTDESLGEVGPAEFIPIAERAGLIVQLGEVVFRKAVAQLAEWHRECVNCGRIAVNVSTHQLESAEFVARFTQIVQSAGLDPSLIELEITESSLVDDAQKGLLVLQNLVEAGFKIAIDDFGTGYSSLTRIAELPISVLKIDQGLVSELPDHRSNGEIIKAVVGMARGLGLEVVAEGVRSDEQAQWLRDSGCHLGQGYHFGKPVPSTSVVETCQRIRKAAGTLASQQGVIEASQGT